MRRIGGCVQNRTFISSALLLYVFNVGFWQVTSDLLRYCYAQAIKDTTSSPNYQPFKIIFL